MTKITIISETITVPEYGTANAFEGKIIVSIGKVSPSFDHIDARIGSIGYANKSSSLKTGDFVIFDRSSEEIYEVRLLQINTGIHEKNARLLVSLLDPAEIVGAIGRLNERIIWSSTRDESEGFSHPEREFLKAKLLLFEQSLKNDFIQNDGQARFVRDKIDHLVQTLDSETKMNWFYMSIGIFTSISMTLGVSAANDDRFWQMIKSVLGVPIQLLLP